MCHCPKKHDVILDGDQPADNADKPHLVIDTEFFPKIPFQFRVAKKRFEVETQLNRCDLINFCNVILTNNFFPLGRADGDDFGW